MMTWIKQVLSPPVFEDEEKNRIVGLLHTILWGTIVLECLRSLIFVFIPHVALLTSLAATVAVVIISGSLLSLLRKGRVTFVGRTFLGLIWVLLTALNVLYGGVRGVGYLIYIEIIVAAGVLLGPYSTVAFTLASIFSGLSLFILERRGVISPNLDMLAAEVIFGTVSQIFVVVSLLIILHRRSFIQTLTRARELSRVLTEENSDLEATCVSLKDQVAVRTRSVERAHQETEAVNIAFQAQIWQFTGLAQLDDVMRGVQDVPALAENIIHQLCAYLEAPVGVLYILDGEDLHLVGHYAYHPLDSAHQHFALGEGLVGQVALEQQPHIVKDVSSSALAITSALGESLPKQIVIYPFLFNQRVSGVIEIGTMYSITETHLAFLRSATASIAVALNTAQARARIDMLLEETQQQTRELQAQEEELRAANEELEAQAENLRLSEARLQEKQAELETLNAVLRQQAGRRGK